MSMTPTTEEAKTKGQSLDLRDLHAANIARQAEWCPDQVPDLSFRGNELGGECGEAQNVIKKLERERQGWRGSRATKDDLADELADVVICADLCAVTADIDLGAAVLRKFNATSEKQGLSVFLPSAPALAVPRADSAASTAGEIARNAFFSRDTDCKTLQFTQLSSEGREDWERAAAAVLAATPAPSSPGVPDSVRALSEAALPGRFKAIRGIWGFTLVAEEGGAKGFLSQADAEFIAASANFVRTLISAHPAGQSDDDAERCIACDKPLKVGERVLPDAEGGTIHAACCGPEREGYTKGDGEPLGQNDPIPQGYVYESERPAGQSAGQGAETDAGLRDAISENVRRAKKDQAFLRRTLTRMRTEPAPDSTRTGQVETEGLPWRDMKTAPTGTPIITKHKPNSSMPHGWVATIILGHDDDERVGSLDTVLHYNGDALYRGFHGCWDGWLPLDALAARPAAPEAQGAWPDPQPMDTAPDDGTNVVALVGKRITTVQCSKHFAKPPHDLGRNVWSEVNYDSLMPCEPKCWWPFPSNTKPLPAPPASSGQESA